MELVLANLEHYAPVVLRGPRLSDEEFLEFCAEHEDLRVESNENGELELMPGTGPDTGDRNAEITHQLRAWAKRDARGRTYDSSTLFILPNGARRSPDAAWVARERIAALPAAQRGHLWRLCPDFVVELRSPSDRLALVDSKMREWIANGVKLGWLIDTEGRNVIIYRPEREPEVLANPASIAGDGPVDGFVLDLKEVYSELP